MNFSKKDYNNNYIYNYSKENFNNKLVRNFTTINFTSIKEIKKEVMCKKYKKLFLSNN